MTALNRGAFSATAALLNKGTVKKWIEERGFGFIVDDADKKEIFVHRSKLNVEQGGKLALTEGQEVEFDIGFKNGKSHAENVRSPGGQPLPSGHGNL